MMPYQLTEGNSKVENILALTHGMEYLGFKILDL